MLNFHQYQLYHDGHYHNGLMFYQPFVFVSFSIWPITVLFPAIDGLIFPFGIFKLFLICKRGVYIITS